MKSPLTPHDGKADGGDASTAREPLARRITQGRAAFDPVAVGIDNTRSFLITDENGRGIAVACVHQEHAERIANAELIAEAFNVTHETGKTPAQLAAENRELREALKSLLNIITHPQATKAQIRHIAGDVKHLNLL